MSNFETKEGGFDIKSSFNGLRDSSVLRLVNTTPSYISLKEEKEKQAISEIIEMLNLSGLAYIDFDASQKGKIIDKVPENTKIIGDSGAKTDGKISFSNWLINNGAIFFKKIIDNGEMNFAKLEDKYELVKQINDSNTGFSMTILKKQVKPGEKQSYVFTIRGTDDFKDFYDNNYEIGKGNLPKQFISLVKYFSNDPDIKKILDSKDVISVVGHSLGGFLAQLLGILYKGRIDVVYTFNSPGVKNIVNINQSYLDELSIDQNTLSSVNEKIGLLTQAYKKKGQDFGNIRNISNSDKIPEFGEHIGISIKGFGSSEHFLDSLRNDFKSILSSNQFNKFFGPLLNSGTPR